jgi:hypothetical protein
LPLTLLNGWQAQVAIKGTRQAKTFSTKAEATVWAAERETQLRRIGPMAGEVVQFQKRTYTDTPLCPTRRKFSPF